MRILASLALLPGFAIAGPTLTAAPYPASGPQPTAVSISVNGSPGPACTLAAGSNGAVVPTCDLTSLTPGSYTIVMTATAPVGCPQPTSPATCISGSGSASSSPFLLTLSAGPAAPAALRVAP